MARLIHFTVRLTDLKPRETSRIVSLDLNEDEIERLAELGIFQGATVSFYARAPFGGPVAFVIDGTIISLDRTTAAKIGIRNV